MLAQAGAVYARVYAQKGQLARVAHFWLIAAFVGGALASYMRPLALQNDVLPAFLFMYFGHAVAAYAILIGWYTLHRYRITGRQPPSTVPQGLVRDRKAFEFIIAQIRNVLLLVVISLLFLIPVTIYLALHVPVDAT